jgi:uncharacterized protein
MNKYSGEAYGQPFEPVPWTWRDISLVVVLVMVGGALLVAAIRVAIRFAGFAPEPGLTSPTFYAATLIIYSLVLLALYVVVAHKWGWTILGLRMPPRWALLITFPMIFAEFIGIAIINSTMAYLMGGFDNPQVESLSGGQAISSAQLALILLLVAGLAPVAEELFFRGMLYPLLRQRLGASLAILISAALFAVMHVIPILFPSLFFVGLLLALLREWSGSTIPCILLHVMQNSVAVIAITSQMPPA